MIWKKPINSVKTYGTAGKKLDKPLKIKVLDENGRPVGGIPIIFSAVNMPKKVKIISSESLTNQEGIATAEVEISKKVANESEIIISASIKDSTQEPLYFYITVHEPNWMKFLFFSLRGQGPRDEFGDAIDA